MKTFVNKKTDIWKGKTEEEGTIGFAELSILALNKPKQGGWGSAEQRRIFKIIDKLEDKEVDVEIQLDDADVELILSCVKSPWGFMHRDVPRLEDYLEELMKGS